MTPLNGYDTIGASLAHWSNATAAVATTLYTTLATGGTPGANLPLSTPSDRSWLPLLNYTLGGENFTHVGNHGLFDEPVPPLDPCDPGNVHFHCTVQEFLEYARGPQQMPLTTALLVTVLFVWILVTGVIGNLIVCLVIIRHPSMRTATNYYLFSLAVSDLILLLLGLPYEISLYWHQYPYNLGLVFCKIRALVSEAATYVSVLTIVAFSMERFLAICHPLHLYTMSGLQRPIRIIAGLWIGSVISAVPFAVFTDIDYIEYPPTHEKIMDSAFCAMLSNPEGIPLWELSTCLFFAAPMVVMIVLYSRMGMQIRSRTRKTAELGVRNDSVHGPSRMSQSKKSIIRMLAAVVITFFVCWAPFHAQRLLFLYARDWKHFNTVNTWLFSVAGWLYYVSCTINPILYNVMSHRYRVAFQETLCGRRRYHGSGFARDQSSFRETTMDVNVGSETSKLLRVRSMMQSQRSLCKTSLHANNSVRYNNNCIRRNSLQIGHFAPGGRGSHSSNTTAEMVVMLKNNLSGRSRCYTTSASTLVSTMISTTSTTTAAAAATDSTIKIPLISINGGSSCLGNNVTQLQPTYNNECSVKENNLSTTTTPLASSRASSSFSIDLNQTHKPQTEHNESPSIDEAESNFPHRQHPNHQLINGFESMERESRSGLKHETTI